MTTSAARASLLSLFWLVAVVGCGDSGPTGTVLTLVPLSAWDGGPDARCTIGSVGERVGCATAYPISGDPKTCDGFDGSGAGSTAACQAICQTGLVCSLSGLSDGTNVVACTASCASPEH